MPVFSKRRDVLSTRSSVISRTRRSRRRYALETLESRTLLAYTFTYNPVTHVATAQGDAATDALVISPIGGLLEHSVNGSAFDSNWTGFNVPAAVTETVDVNLSTGDGSSLKLGGNAGAHVADPASLMFGAFVVVAPANTTDTTTIDDSKGTTLAAAAYTINTLPGFISGPGIDYDQSGSQAFQGGVTLMGSGANGNTYAVLSVCCGGATHEPMTVQTGATGLQTVNVGSGGTLTINSTLAIFDPAGDPTTVNINDTADTTHSTATLDDLSGNPAAPFEVTGLSAFPIEYGAGVTALNINGGTFGALGVTYNINNTQAGTTTTINGGPNDDTFNLSFVAHNLSDLAGPVVINGNGGTNSAELFDQNGAGGSYAIDGTTVAAPGFAGLTYGTISTLTVDSSDNASTVDVNDTASGGTLNVNTGANDGSTVNVIADNEQVNITSAALATVNIGSTGGPGTMAGIQGPISVLNPPSLTDLIFHDENDATGQTWTLDNDDGLGTGSVAVTGSATTSYDPFDLGSLTVNGGSGGNTFIVNATSAFYPTTLNTGFGDDTTNVFATGGNTLDIHGQDGQDTVTLGADPVDGMQNLFGTINVENGLGFTDLTLDDSADTTGQTALLFNDGTNGQVTGLSPATINYVNDDTSSLTVFGGSGGNTFTVDGTITNTFMAPVITSLNTGFGDDTTFVEATAAGGPLDVHGQAGQDTVLVSFFGSVADILGTVTVNNTFGFTDLTVDASADAVSHDFTLSSGGPLSTLTGLAPADIIYTTGDVSSLTIGTSAFGTQVMNIDMSGGNPIPFVNTPGLIFNAGADFGNVLGSHAMNIFGDLPSGPFASEIHNANDHGVFPQIGQYGSIFFDDGLGSFSSLTSLNYTGLLPINDTTAAVDYTFNDFADDQSFAAIDGPTVLGFDTVEFANTPAVPPPTFETTNVANKTNIVFNTPGPTTGIFGVVDIPTPSTGLASLTFNTPTGGDNTVSFVNTPPGVVTSLNGGSDEDVTNVIGMGVPDGTVLFLNGGAGINTLNYDAGGETPTIVAGLLPGEVLISIPGFGTVDAINYQIINIVNAAPVVITPGPAVTINTVEGFQNVDAIVGTFTVPIPILPGPPAGFPASDFTASIDWGDPTPDPDAGTIIQDASNPSVYYIKGTHTFIDTGTYTVANTVAFAGGTITVPVNGVPITINFGPAGPTAGTDATANVTQGPLAVSAFPIVGTEGVVIPSAPIATFIDAGGADPVGDYSATINVFDSTNTLIVSVPAALIFQHADAAQYTVVAPDLLLPEEGTYQVEVLVTDDASPDPITVSGRSFAVIADAPLTAGPDVLQAINTGVPVSFDYLVGHFTDANPGGTLSDFTGVVDWGDGSPNSVAIISNVLQPPGEFDVFARHTYAKPGDYFVRTHIVDVGGSRVQLNADFTVTDLPVTGATRSFTTVEGQNTGLFVLAVFEDPNTLATLSDVRAELDIGGWGDGTPGVAGIGLTVQQIGVDPANGEPIFEVLGSHTYAEETFPGLPDTLSVIITTFGGATTTLTSPPGGGVTVLDAKLTGSSGNSITGIEGNDTGTVLLGSFVDANQGADVADFTTGTGIVLVDWGDGGAPLPLGAGNLAAIGTPDGVVWLISAAHTYDEAGTYSYTVTVFDTGGSFTTVSGTAAIADADLTADPTLLQVGNTGVPLVGIGVGSFTDGNPVATTSDFTGVIDWGDGSANSVAFFTNTGPGTFDVSGSHTYAQPGVYDVTTNVFDDDGETTTVTATFTITDLAVTGDVNNFSGVEGQDTGTIVLATYTDPNTLATVANEHATLPPGGWGDGTPGGTVTLTVAQIGVDEATGAPIFRVTGSHKYAEEGVFTVNINVTTSDGTTTALTPGTATIVDAKLTGTSGTEITGIEGNTTGSVFLGSFTDANQGATIADFTVPPGSVVVDWGDGSLLETLGAGNLTLTGSPNGVTFNINAAHTYNEEGTYGYTVTVTDDGGSVTIVSGSAIIADAAISLAGFTTIGVPEGTTVTNFDLIQFADANPVGVISDFTASIDWGDGLPNSVGTVTQPGGVGTLFHVLGTHTYIEEGTFTITVTVIDAGGAEPLVATTSAVITDAVLSAPTQPTVAATEAIPFVNVPVSYFVDPNLFGGVSDFSASIAWGANAAVATTTGVVQLVGHTAPGAPVAGLVYQVIGSNTYTEEGTSTITVTINDVGGAPTLTTTTTATTVDAQLTSSNGTEITGIEGSPTISPAGFPLLGTFLGTFTDANQGATVADFTSGGGSVVVDWGDGSAAQTLLAANLTVVGTPNGVIFRVNASHTYAEEGTYAYTVTVTDDGGSVTIFGGSAIIGDAVLTASGVQPIVTSTETGIFPVPQFGKPTFFNSPVASYTDANPLAPISDFTATIDWGDGTPPSAGKITQPGGVGTAFVVTGSHTYADAGQNGGTGTYPMQIFIVDDGESRLTIFNTANVPDRPIILTGILNPATDSGLSTGTINVTNVKQPDFFGNSEPLSTVSLSATLLPGGVPVPIGQVEAGSDGSWNIQSFVALADGHYAITATAIDQFGMTTTTAPTVITPDLLIDTRGPVITGMFFNRLNGQVDYTIQDPGGTPSGVWINSLLDSANYELIKVHPQLNFPGQWIVTNVTVTVDPSTSNAYDVAVTINNGKVLPGGFWLFTIRDTSSGEASVQDLAENHLDGEFYGSFPSGNHINAGDFVAELQAYHNKIFAPQTIIGTANAANGGVGGPRVNPVHSGVFVTAIPRGGSPIFSTPTSHSTPVTARKGKGQAVVKVKHGHSLVSHHANAVKHALVVGKDHPKGVRG